MLHIIVYLTIDNESSQSIVNYNILIISFVFLDYIYGKSDLNFEVKKIKLKFLGISCQIFYFHNKEEKVHVILCFDLFIAIILTFVFIQTRLFVNKFFSI